MLIGRPARRGARDTRLDRVTTSGAGGASDGQRSGGVRVTGQTIGTLRADTDRDRIFTAGAAREYGLVDHVIDQR